MAYRALLELARTCERTLRIGVVYPDYREVFRALKKAEDLCFSPVLIGPREAIDRAVSEIGLSKYTVEHAEDPESAARIAVELAVAGELELIMKGSVSTAILMSAVLHNNDGIKTGALLSHIAVFESADGRFLGVTDGGLNIQPTVEQKVDIIRNAVNLFHHIGVPCPRVALLSGVEIPSSKIPSTLEAVELTEMAVNGAFPDAIVEGPMAFDLAFNPAASRAKHYQGEIRGDADILIVPELVSGNILGKALNHAAGFASGGVVVGAKIPIVLLSRSDRAQEKLNSMLLAGALV
jgi:phosphate butyryltransferase